MQLGQVGVKILRVEVGFERRVLIEGVIFAGGEGGQDAACVLHVRDVSAEAEDCAGIERVQAMNVGETSEGTIRC